MNCPVKCCGVILLGTFFGMLTPPLRGDTSWINPADGFWREPANWSFGVPDAGQAVTYIGFGGASKTVTVDAATPGTNLVIQRLSLSGPGITNTLLLSGVVLEARSTLEMREGSVLRIVDSTLRLPSSGSSFDVNAGEVWLESGSIDALDVDTRVGRDGGKALMRVESGTAQLSEVLLGRRVTRSGAEGILHLSGGLLEIVGNFDVGADTNCTGQIVVTGGELMATDTNFSTAIGEQGNGLLMISNGVVHLDEVDVGRHRDVIGAVYAAGGSTWIEDFSLGRFPLSTGMVFQTDGQLVVGDVVRVGEQGRGEMTLSGGSVLAERMLIAGLSNTASGLLIIDGGTTVISSNFMVGTAVSTGEVVFAGGVLAVTNKTASASLAVRQGTADLTGGSIVVDRFEMADAAGRMDFHRGFLSSAGTVVSNGLPFVIGDGTNAATFHMRGGTHSFQDGLVISPNAMLTGCGVILGTINNQGTIATNFCPVAPRLVNPLYFNNGFSFSFDSQAGALYTVEFQEAPDAPPWNLLFTTNGTGGSITITDTPLAPSSRFYRVRAE